MPTGYTACIADGVSFEEFVMTCARGMGALIDMRDAPTGAPIPERFEPSNYHSKKAFEALCALQALSSMSLSDIDKASEDEYKAAIAEKANSLARINALRDKYESMMAKVLVWKAPSPDHIEFKKFMVEQLRSSIDFDCNVSYYESLKPTRLSVPEWLDKEQVRLRKEIKYHEAEYLAEVKRVEARNQWLRRLRESLNNPTKA